MKGKNDICWLSTKDALTPTKNWKILMSSRESPPPEKTIRAKNDFGTVKMTRSFLYNPTCNSCLQYVTVRIRKSSIEVRVLKSIICFFCCPNLDYTSKFCTAHRCSSRKEHTREIVTLYEEQACYAATLVVSLHGFHGNKMDENAPCNFRIIFNVNVWGTAKIYKNNLKYMFGVSHIWVVLKPPAAWHVWTSLPQPTKPLL